MLGKPEWLGSQATRAAERQRAVAFPYSTAIINEAIS